MSVSQILTDYNGQPTSLCIAGGGGGSGTVNSVSAGPGLTITGAPTTNPTVNLGFTGLNQLLYGTGLNAGTLLGPGAPGDFLRINNATTPALEWHPISASGVVSVSANPGGDIYVNNNNTSTPAVAIGFPAGGLGCIPSGNGTAASGPGNFSQGGFTSPLVFPANQNYVLTASNMAANGCDWAPAAGVVFTGEPPLVEYVDGTLSKIAIDFTALSVGQIPVGISDAGGKLGTLTPALAFPADEGKVLVARAANVATGGYNLELNNAGSVVSVSAAANNVIFVDNTAPTAPKVAVGFAEKGDLVAGTGANTGVLLPIGTVNQVLECFPSAPSGLRWVDEPSSGGGPIINRSSKPVNTGIDGPTKISDTMILVAEETNSYWDAIPNPVPPSSTDPYKVEFASIKITVASGPGFIDRQFIGLVAVINGARCVQVWEKYGGGEVGHFYNDKYTKDAFVYDCQGPFAGAGNGYDKKFVVGGQFTHFADNIGTITEINNIALIDPTTSIISNLEAATTGLGGVVAAASPFKVARILYDDNFPDHVLVACGCFSAILANPPITGYLSVCCFDTDANAWSSIATSVGPAGLGVAYTDGTPGIINDAWIDNLSLFFACAGEWEQLAITMSPDTFFPAPATFKGFAVSNQVSPFPGPGLNRWANTPAGAAGLDYGFCVRESTAIPGYLIVAGEYDGASQQVILCDIASSTTSAPNTNAPGWAGVNAGYNSIASGQVEVTAGGGLVQCDFVMLMEVGKDVSIYYFPAGIVFPYTATQLLPNPAGLIPDDTGGAITSYGIRVGLDQVINANILNVSCKTALFEYSPDQHPTGIAFTLAAGFGFKQGNTTTTTATFAVPAFQSQSYIASADLKNWIQIGAVAPSLTYT